MIKRLVDVRSTPRTPAVAHANAFTGAGNHGFIFIALKPLDEARCAMPTAVIEAGCGARAGACRWRRPSSRPRRTCASAAGSATRSTSTRSRRTTSAGSLAKWGPVLLARDEEAAGAPRRELGSAERRALGIPHLRPHARGRRRDHAAGARRERLYTAFGQSTQASVIYTQLNQYYVVLEAAPDFRTTASAGRAARSLCADAVTASTSRKLADRWCRSRRSRRGSRLDDRRRCCINHTGLFPSVTVSFNLAPELSLMSDATLRLDRSDVQRAAHGTPASIHGFFSGTLAGLPGIARQRTPILVLTALLAVYIGARHPLRGGLIHPLTIDISTLPSASVPARCWRSSLFHNDLNVILDHFRHRAADRHRQEERDS